VAAASAVVLGALSAASPASAHFSGGGQTLPTISVRPYSYNPTWQAPMDRALANWNATPTRAYFFKQSTSASTVTAASYPDNWYGHYRRCGTACMVVRLNSRRINQSATNFGYFVTSVLVHEFGHALNCADNTYYPSVMDENRARNSSTMSYPQPHDNSDVNVYYPR
jgi:hypothetical protein